MSLTIDDFPGFFRAVHGDNPFPWQDRLARHVAVDGWPKALDIPTGCGKTAAIDAAVFTLALQANQPIEQRRAPVRIAFVVDRRLVVDDAFARACKLSAALADASGDGVLARVARRLRRLAEDEKSPLAVARLRGGLPHEPDWARTPSQPTVLVSTVDQVGSRLLFRGYGVSSSMRPIHAGLLGRDALLLLDEAHLSQPFLQTLRDLESPPWPGTLSSSPFQVVSMTATPADAAGFRLDGADRANQTLTRRLIASKPATLIAEKPASFVEAFVRTARQFSLAGGGSAHVTGIVVNRVARARAIFDALGQATTNGLTADVVLLIGRTRDVDRDTVLTELLPRMRAGRREDVGPPLIVVATQCIEAGADLDFDALVTEIAPLDCLRQRLGRLNRLGRHDTSPTAIIAKSDEIGARAVDPIYGTALRDTYLFLQQLKSDEVDFGLNAASAWLPQGEALKRLLAPRTDAPLLLPRDPHLWACTSPVPAVDPAAALYLHGPDAAPADVQIVWRKELDGTDQDGWAEWIEACPPVPGEVMPVPIYEARRWLTSTASGDIADVEGRGTGDEVQGAGRDFRIWRNGEVCPASEQPRPGDTIIVAASRGGADRWGWNPTSTAPVTDVADAAMQRAGRRRVLRLIAPDTIDAATLAEYAELSDRAVLADLNARGLLEADRGMLLRRQGSGTPLAVLLRAPDAASEDDTSSLTAARPRRLVEHTDGVVDMARRFADRLGLGPTLSHDLLLAARLHDAGKAHPDFQRYLHGGDELAAAGGVILAKSGRTLGPEVRQRAGLPNGARHEVASLRLAEAHPMFAAAHDPALVLWLIGTHHGHGRPLFPAVEWPAAGDSFVADTGGGSGSVHARAALSAAALTARWLELREALHRRFGPWWLAHLEAVLRLADHRTSEQEVRV